MKDDGFVPLTDFVPINVSDSFHYTRGMCKTREQQNIWDAAVKECIKSVVLETKGFSLEQIEDLKWLLFGEWDWQQDAEFIKEAEKKGKYHTQPKPQVGPVKYIKDGGDRLLQKPGRKMGPVDNSNLSMWQKVKDKVFW